MLYSKYFRYLRGLNEDYLSEDIEGMKKYYPNIPDEEFQTLIELDPTYKRGSKNAGTYGKWILGMANKNGGKLERINHISDILQRFEDNKKLLKNKDILKFKSVEDLENYLNDESNYNELSDRQKLRQTQRAVHNTDIATDAKKVYEDDDWIVYTPNTYEASCKLGQGTSWCTASTEQDYYYNYYTNQGDLYININKHDPNEKYQFHFETASFMDAKDNSIDLAKFFDKYPKLHEFYKPQVNQLYGIDETGMGHYEVSYREFIEGMNNYRRDGWSEDFIQALFWPEAQDYLFEVLRVWPEDEYTSDLSFPDLRDVLSEENYRLMNILGYSAEDVNSAQSTHDFDGDVDVAWQSAVAEGFTAGALKECVKDFDKATSQVFENQGISYTGADWGISFTVPENIAVALINAYGTADDVNEAIGDGLGQMFGKAFQEPYYGWNDFDNEAFSDSLEMTLADVVAERGLSK